MTNTKNTEITFTEDFQIEGRPAAKISGTKRDSPRNIWLCEYVEEGKFRVEIKDAVEYAKTAEVAKERFIKRIYDIPSHRDVDVDEMIDGLLNDIIKDSEKTYSVETCSFPTIVTATECGAGVYKCSFEEQTLTNINLYEIIRANSPKEAYKKFCHNIAEQLADIQAKTHMTA